MRQKPGSILREAHTLQQVRRCKFISEILDSASQPHVLLGAGCSLHTA